MTGNSLGVSKNLGCENQLVFSKKLMNEKRIDMPLDEIPPCKTFFVMNTYNFRDFLEEIERYSFIGNLSTVRHAAIIGMTVVVGVLGISICICVF